MSENRFFSFDTETTGIDFHHGALPFFLTTCNERQQQVFYQWEIDPLTRKVTYPSAAIEEIAGRIQYAEVVVGQNIKFDYHALKAASLESGQDFLRYWEWDKVEDTLIAGHILASNRPHNLTDMASQYLGVNIAPLEVALKKACTQARHYAKKRFPDWRLAKKGLPDMPSCKGGDEKKKRKGVEAGNPWRFDMWLPRAIAKELNYPLKLNQDGSINRAESHNWWYVLTDYSNADSAITLGLWNGFGSWHGMERELRNRGLWAIYRERMKLVPIAQQMEWRGVTITGKEVHSLQREYRTEVDRLGRVCAGIAKYTASNTHPNGFPLELPKGASPNDSLRSFVFGEDGLNLPQVPSDKAKKKKSNIPSLDKSVLEKLELMTEPDSVAHLFLSSLLRKRKRDTALSYLAGYHRFMLPLIEQVRRDEKLHLIKHDDWFVLHPSYNSTGTDTLRWSMSNPNSANVEKEAVDGRTLRDCLGPSPGREWWKDDYQNLELRIPAFKAPEPELVEVFSHPERGPYYGSYHLVVADLLYPGLFKLHGKKFKDLFAATLYQWIKNGNFAIIYGAAKEKADLTFRFPGAYDLIQGRFPNIARLGREAIREANKKGYVETFADRDIDPNTGYPLMVLRTEWGKAEPTKPLNYKIQGTAMQLTNRAMVKCQAQLDLWRKRDGFDGYIAIQCHDEIVFDFPKSKRHPSIDLEIEKECAAKRARGEPSLDFRLLNGSNLWRARILQNLMVECGSAIGVPTPVTMSYCEKNWATGVEM